MTRKTFYLIIALLMLVGIGTAILRHVYTGEPFLPGTQQDVWQVEARIQFDSLGGATQVKLALPDESPGFVLFNERAASPGFGFSIVQDDGTRRGVWTKREASGPQTLYYIAEFVTAPNHDVSGIPVPEIQTPIWPGAAATAARQLLTKALEHSSDTPSLVRELSKLLSADEGDQNAAFLQQEGFAPPQLLSALLNEARVPARVIMGLFLEDARRQQQLQAMVQVFDGQDIIIVDPQTGAQGAPANLLLWNQESSGILEVSGARSSSLGFSMLRQAMPATQIARQHASGSIFNLLGVHLLPIEAQSTFKLLFLLPLGALVVVFMRLLVGIKTSGTFMPILIALAFLETQLLPGILIFVLIVLLGLMLRSYLSYLNLLMVARIATLIILVIAIMAVMSLLAYELGITSSVTITFFPMIILAWTIERMSILWEEEGPKEVLIQGSGSLLVAVMAFGLMSSRTLLHLSFNFPELNLVVLALILLMGQYTGYRLSELYRFRDLMEVIDDPAD